MTEIADPSTPQEAALSDQYVDSIPGTLLPIYSPLQVRLASFIGGPFAPVYTLYQNFKQLNDARGMQLTLMYGIGFNLALLALLPFLPDRFPRQLIPLIYAWAAGWVASSKQLTKEKIIESTQFRRRSGWNVTGVSVLSLLGFCLVSFPLLFLLDYLGIINLA